MPNKRETPAYGSPELEPTSYPRPDMSAFVATRSELSSISTDRIMFMVETEIPESHLRKAFRDAAKESDRLQTVNMAAQLLAFQRAKVAKVKADRDSRQRIRMEPIAIGPEDVLPVSPRRITPQPMARPDPEETIPAPVYPIRPPSMLNEEKKTVVIPPRESDPEMPRISKPQYPQTTPIEFLPRTLLPKTSYSFILDLEKEKE